MRYLGIDFGTKKVGLALSDEAGRMGFPHAIVPNDGRLLQAVLELIALEKVGAIVMGESTDFSGAENAVMKDARAFAEALAKDTNLPVHYEPEMLTTQAARRDPEGVRTSGKEAVDASAAALILTAYLERPKGKPRISIEEFSKIEVRMGTVRTAEVVPEADKLLRLMVDFGEGMPRQIVSGIRAYVEDPASLVGRQLAFVTNLEPRTIRGLESNGMLFAVGEGDTFAFVTPDRSVPPGTGAH